MDGQSDLCNEIELFDCDEGVLKMTPNELQCQELNISIRDEE